MTSNDSASFEQEVRRIARAKWPAAGLRGGALMLAGRERDGVFETDECVHFIEATVSRQKDKATEDAKKLQSAVQEQLRKTPTKAAKGWFVTKEEPTADQRTAVNVNGKGAVVAVSFAQFQQSIVDVPAYLAARHNHSFGSVLDPVTRDRKPTVPYVALDMAERKTGDLWSVPDLVQALIEGKRFLLLGDYGAGKSMTLRQVFLNLSNRYQSGNSSVFPVYLNLREHSGQRDAIEVIERHARNIGFENPASLVRAWRAGFVLFIIDGFDEITTLGAQALWKRLRDTRKRALEAVRRLVLETPKELGVVIAGREHFFDSEGERELALGLNGEFSTLSLNEFTEAQVGEYLKRAKLVTSVSFPAWLPTRPLLVGYVATRGVATNIFDSPILADSVDGWDMLLAEICEREAKIESNLDGPTLRRVLERVATLARASVDGLGPVTAAEIQKAFTDVCGYPPDELAGLILQRLPGLGVHRAEDDTRIFLDRELAEVCRARDVQGFVETPHGSLDTTSWREIFSGIESFAGNACAKRVARNLAEKGLGAGHLRHAVIAAGKGNLPSALVADLLAASIEGNLDLNEVIYISDVVFQSSPQEFQNGSLDLSKVTFKDCYFQQVELDSETSSKRLPKFDSCFIGVLVGRNGPQDLPAEVFIECHVERFGDSIQTTDAILSSSLSIGERVTLTILRKLYLQSLSGRQEAALFRGLDHNEKRFVEGALKCLQKHDMATRFNKGNGNLWLPVRKNLDRARRILLSPTSTVDILIEEAKQLK